MNGKSFSDMIGWIVLAVVVAASLALGIHNRVALAGDKEAFPRSAELQLDEMAEEVRDIREEASRSLVQVGAIGRRLDALEESLVELEGRLHDVDPVSLHEEAIGQREALGEASKRAAAETNLELGAGRATSFWGRLEEAGRRVGCDVGIGTPRSREPGMWKLWLVAEVLPDRTVRLHVPAVEDEFGESERLARAIEVLGRVARTTPGRGFVIVVEAWCDGEEP